MAAKITRTKTDKEEFLKKQRPEFTKNLLSKYSGGYCRLKRHIQNIAGRNTSSCAALLRGSGEDKVSSTGFREPHSAYLH